MTRKYFGTDGIRGTANQGKMTPEIAMRLGMAAGKYFRSTDARRPVSYTHLTLPTILLV